MEINEIYHARWKEREWGDQKDHCFEGLFLVMEDNHKTLWLVDSYWGVGRWDNKKYTPDEAKEKFELTYYCNLDEIEPVKGHRYYKDEDIFMLHDQHACVEGCKYYYKKKGVDKDKDTIINLIKGKIQDKKKEIEWAQDDIKRLGEDLEKVYQDNLEVYI